MKVCLISFLEMCFPSFMCHWTVKQHAHFNETPLVRCLTGYPTQKPCFYVLGVWTTNSYRHCHKVKPATVYANELSGLILGNAKFSSTAYWRCIGNAACRGRCKHEAICMEVQWRGFVLPLHLHQMFLMDDMCHYLFRSVMMRRYWHASTLNVKDNRDRTTAYMSGSCDNLIPPPGTLRTRMGHTRTLHLCADVPKLIDEIHNNIFGHKLTQNQQIDPKLVAFSRNLSFSITRNWWMRKAVYFMLYLLDIHPCSVGFLCTPLSLIQSHQM